MIKIAVLADFSAASPTNVTCNLSAADTTEIHGREFRLFYL
jgi:hypothetical protein